MNTLEIAGCTPLKGQFKPTGNKNAVMPMLCASLLTNDTVTLTNVPDISDVTKFAGFFESCGSEVVWDKAAATLTVNHAKFSLAGNAAFPSHIRSSLMLIAPILLRGEKVVLDFNVTGCALGVREIDPHIEHLVDHGVPLDRANNVVTLLPPSRFTAASCWPDYASVTGTSTFLLCSVMAHGISRMHNHATEPHVRAVVTMLQGMGGQVGYDSSGTLRIEGVSSFSGGTFEVPDDHHEIATFAAIAAASGGTMSVSSPILADMPLIMNQLGKLGVQYEMHGTDLEIKGWSRQVTVPFTETLTPKIEAAPWPYFPADLLPQLIGLGIGCDTPILFWNKVYEGALNWVPELTKLGARVTMCDPHRVIVGGSGNLKPGTVESPYIIRVAVGLVIATMQCEGVSTIRNASPIARAHPNFLEKLTALGADIKAV